MKNLFATVGIALTSSAWVWTGSSCGFGAAQNNNSQSAGKAMAQAPIQPQSRSKHSAKDLEEFYLADKVSVRGLGTSAALEKLRLGYEDTCRQTGEVPLKLSFVVPAGHEAPLGIDLKKGSLGQQLSHVAAASKMELTREGATYRFREPRETGGVIQKTVAVAPDMLWRLSSGEPSAAERKDAGKVFRKFGVNLEDSTKVSIRNGQLSLESQSAADEAAVSNVLDLVTDAAPKQQKYSAKIFEVSADSNWVAPQTGNYDRKAFNRLAVSLATQKGVDLITLPSLTCRIQEEGLAEIGGVKLSLYGELVGMGHRLESNLDLGKNSHISDKGYVSDGGARIVVARRPDGSTVILVVEATLIDATGRPVRAKNR